MSFETTALLLTWAGIVLLALVVAGLVRQVQALGQGAHPPDSGPAVGGPAPSLDRLAAEPGRPTLVLFLSDDCGICQAIAHEVRDVAVALPVRAVFPADPLAVEPSEGVQVLAGRGDLFEEYAIPATPYGVLIGADGRIVAAEPVGSVRALHDLTERAGAPAPASEGRAR